MGAPFAVVPRLLALVVAMAAATVQCHPMGAPSLGAP